MSPPNYGCLAIYLGFEVSCLICGCLVVLLGFEVSPPLFVGVWLFSWGLNCLPPLMDVG